MTNEEKFPCENCLTYAICNAEVNENEGPFTLALLINKCCLLKAWIKYTGRDYSISVDKDRTDHTVDYLPLLESQE